MREAMDWASALGYGRALARARGATPEDAEDAAQQACFKMWKAYGKEPQPALVLVVTQRCLYDMWRVRQPSWPLWEAEGSGNAENEAITRLELQEVWRRLSPRARRRGR